MVQVTLQTQSKLSAAGVRPTRQRLLIAALLWKGNECRHVTPEDMRREIQQEGEDVALATIYNTLHQFTKAGLLREIVLAGGRTYFDTNLSPHFHYYYEENGHLEDVAISPKQWHSLPSAPPGTEVKGVDVVIRVGERK
ncbi:MAG: transcriptional repressor [Alphaproteobacteria bacterium]|nr:transcriptional repressor [Alphaproteobacteria bacterium]